MLKEFVGFSAREYAGFAISSRYPHHSACAQAGEVKMKPEFRIREVTRYVITRHDSNGTQALAEVSNANAAQEILVALQAMPLPAKYSDDMLIQNLGLQERTSNLLRSKGITTVGALRKASASQLRTIEQIGPKTISEIEAMQLAIR